MATNELMLKLTIIILYLIQIQEAVIMRNNALMNKMVSHFQKDIYHSQEQGTENQKQEDSYHNSPQQENMAQKPERVMSMMQNVLCRNFPAIPCNIITADDKLRQLIQKSIQQIKYKSLAIDTTTAPPGYHLTLFPTINSEDMSNFLQERHSSFQNKRNAKDKTPQTNKIQRNGMKYWSQEKTKRSLKRTKKESSRTTVYNGRKKLRKFYPHKIKYKDKNVKNVRKDFGDYSEEKLSMSVEVPDMTLTKRHEHLNYRVEPADPPVWRIDYMKHGEPSLNMLGYEDDRLNGKLVKTGPTVIVDENMLEHGARKDVLHPDVYIKKNFIRKNPVELNSEGMD